MVRSGGTLIVTVTDHNTCTVALYGLTRYYCTALEGDVFVS